MDFLISGRSSSHLSDVFLTFLIELDDGKNYRKALYLMVKTMVSGLDFPLNQSNEFLNQF